jgi:hypothetical protein
MKNIDFNGRREAVRNRIRIEERRVKGLCLQCGQDAYGLSRCGECAVKHINGQRRRRAREREETEE